MIRAGEDTDSFGNAFLTASSASDLNPIEARLEERYEVNRVCCIP
jgi:hypothetical protein